MSSVERSDLWWIADGLSYHLVRKLGILGSRQTGRGRTIRRVLEGFSFIPTVDQILRAPRFPNSSLYLDQVDDPPDTLRDDLERVMTPRVRGRTIVAKLLLMKPGSLTPLLRSAFEAPKGPRRNRFRERAAAIAGRKLGGFFELWTGPRPPVDLSIKEVTLSETTVAVTLRRRGLSPEQARHAGPVEVQVESGGRKRRAVWDGTGGEGRIELPRDSWLVGVELDPSRIEPQRFRGNDSWPAYLKVLLNRFSIQPDLNGRGEHSGAIGLTLLPGHRYDHPITLDAFKNREGEGLALGYSRGLGNAVDRRTYSLSAGAGLKLERLDSNFKSAGARPASKGQVSSLTLGARYTTRGDRRNADSTGLTIRSGAEISDPSIGSDFEFVRMTGSGAIVLSPFGGHALGVEVSVVRISGRDVPTQRLPDLGGTNLRSLQTGDFSARALATARFEWRHSIATELEQGVPGGLAWLRGLDGIAFIETGDVGADFAQIYEHPGDWKIGIGYGLRFHADAFGARTTVLGFDIARRVDQSPDRPLLFYFSLNHSF